VLRWSLGDGGDPYALAEAQVQRFSQAPLPDLPPFAGGAVGYFGYDLVRTVEPLGEPNPDTLGLPDMALMRVALLVVADLRTASSLPQRADGASLNPCATSANLAAPRNTRSGSTSQRSRHPETKRQREEEHQTMGSGQGRDR
jgi:anthranilate/para-aminobenzoate synthase component I